MEFSFDINVLFQRQVTRTVGGRVPQCKNQNGYEQMFAAVVNEMGLASARAQGLRVPITTFQKLQSTNQVLYVLKEDKGNSGNGAVVGVLKVGHKRLFLMDSSGIQHEVEPLCVLDFYVHESRQRSGCGKKLFESMMQMEGVKPFEVAIDRPSPKFLAFLRKHYKLQSYVKQANNFVVFDQFFSNCEDINPRSKRLSLHRQGSSSPPPNQKTWKRFGNSSVERPSPQSETPTHSVSHNHGDTAGGASDAMQGSSLPVRRFHDDKETSINSQFNWSPDCVTKKQTRLQTIKQAHNVITGTPFVTALPQGTRGDSENSAKHEPSRAPFLNMRQHYRNRGRVSNTGVRYAMPAIQSLGFYSAGGNPRLDRYSRHGSTGDVLGWKSSGAVSNLASGLTGTSLLQHSTRNPSFSKDKWKSHIT